VGSAFHIENFGCRAARADGEAVGERLRASGHCLEPMTEADVVIVNTCSVTAEADRAARAFIRRAHRLNPDARILVTGCYAQRAPEELARIDGVSAVVGNSHKALAPEVAIRLAGDPGSPAKPSDSTGFVPVASLLGGWGAAVPTWVDGDFAHSFLEEAQLVPGTQTRPNLKVQEGCNNRCTFCIIPETRGPSRSLEAETVLRQVRNLVTADGKELVLSGINLGRWGREMPAGEGVERHSLARLVRRILEETQLPRLRLSSVEPMDWGADLLAVIRDYTGTRLARHAHLPLQSGSDAVLRRMHRRYRPWHYTEKVMALIDAFGPGFTLGADVMVGFPGETDREFEETCRLVRELPFGYLHIFPFSPRPGTRGWTLHAGSPVPAKVVRERQNFLVTLASDRTHAHRKQFVGSALDAITLHTPDHLRDQGRTLVLTENFLPAELKAILPANRFTRITVTEIRPDMTLIASMEV